MLKTLVVVAAAVIGAAALAPQLLQRAVEREAPPALAAKTLKPSPDAGRTVTLLAGPDGHFRTEAMIGGRRAPMLVDTGATVVAFSYETGRDLGLISGGDRFDLPVATANGSVGARQVTAPEIRIGSISVTNVPAVVLAPGAMDGNLLGMSFLSRLKRMESTRDRLVLER
ncbi:peptidase [Methylopila jiangsuensis]|uniref:Peptidase n=1 Tax=Methylopila jiangsuensis TaxID=586230 RepID=A0A9W6N3Z1_9HYPH|nr:TIGR02281 family clan AA aspartic protease [Methylopila jiangsuensis]MDR6285052.1 aspartyl protease family protein [Methylopila jiangsuensis]GLK77559.1 peptidase [Methylopila jiangsuensis]